MSLQKKPRTHSCDGDADRDGDLPKASGPLDSEKRFNDLRYLRR